MVRSYQVSTVRPSSAEIQAYHFLPLPLTAASRPIGRLEAIAKIRGIDESWENRKGLLWTHIDDHLIQNKTMCMNALRSVSNGNIESFFEAVRTMRREFYVLHIRNALIHPSGQNYCGKMFVIALLFMNIKALLDGIAVTMWVQMVVRLDLVLPQNGGKNADHI